MKYLLRMLCVLVGVGWLGIVLAEESQKAEQPRLVVQTGAVGMEFSSLAISHDGKTVATGSDAQIILWDVITGRQIRTLQGDSGYVSSISFSPDGKSLASLTALFDVGHPRSFEYADSGQGFTLKVWDISTGKLVRETDKCFGFSVQYSPDGNKIVAGVSR